MAEHTDPQSGVPAELQQIQNAPPHALLVCGDQACVPRLNTLTYVLNRLDVKVISTDYLMSGKACGILHGGVVFDYRVTPTVEQVVAADRLRPYLRTEWPDIKFPPVNLNIIGRAPVPPDQTREVEAADKQVVDSQFKQLLDAIEDQNKLLQKTNDHLEFLCVQTRELLTIAIQRQS